MTDPLRRAPIRLVLIVIYAMVQPQLLARVEPLLEVPFRPQFRGVAFCTVSVNGGRPLQFIVDTGGPGVMIDRQLATMLGMQVVPGRASVSGAAALDVDVVPSAVVQLGKIHFRTRMMATPLQSLARVFGQPFDGIVGGDLLKHFVGEFDYDRRVIRLYRPAHYQPSRHAAMLPLKIVDGTPFVDLELTLPNGKQLRGPFLIDTGAGGSAVQVYRAVAQREHLLDGLTTVNEVGHGMGGITHRTVARAVRLTIGPYRLERPPVAFTEDAAGLRANPQSVGLIGIEVLRRFTVAVDYAGGRILFAPNHHTRESFIYDATGLRLRSDPPSFESVYVSSVVDGSPAQQAGLQASDTLLRIDRHDVSHHSLEYIRDLLYDTDREHQLAVVRAGETIEVVVHTRDILP